MNRIKPNLNEGQNPPTMDNTIDGRIDNNLQKARCEFKYSNLDRTSLSEAIEELRVDVTLANENFNGLPPIAESHFLICMSLLQQAENHARLVNYSFMRKM
jgi:MarR-like DNA-binding transcriptional regulator SgrR of sgrS sRNA